MRTDSQVTISSSLVKFMQLTLAKITLHSEPIELAKVTTDQEGTFTWTGQLPESVRPGFHLITVDGIDESGQPMQIQQFITVTGPQGEELGICDIAPGWYDESIGYRCSPDGGETTIKEGTNNVQPNPFLSSDRIATRHSSNLLLKTSEESELWTDAPFATEPPSKPLLDGEMGSPSIVQSHQDDVSPTDSDGLTNYVWIGAGVIVLLGAIMIGLRQRH